jgi:hypothetical protein
MSKEQIRTTVVFPPLTHTAVKYAASKERRNFNAQVVFACEEYLRQNGYELPLDNEQNELNERLIRFMEKKGVLEDHEVR